MERSSGVFLWVVLVIDILNKEDRRGRHALRKRLADVPSGLRELFKELIGRDHEESSEEFKLCVLWVLCSKRPLRIHEYYHAIWAGLALKSPARNEQEEDELEEVPSVRSEYSAETMAKSLISSSKGLAEVAKGTESTVQFIHESVRDFLIKDEGIYQLWPDLEMDWQCAGNEVLKKTCYSYLSHLMRAAQQSHQPMDALCAEYPLAGYAVDMVLEHGNYAARVYSQDSFLSEFDVGPWVKAHFNSGSRFPAGSYQRNVSLTYVLAHRGLPLLLKAWLKMNPNIDVLRKKRGDPEYPLFAALKRRDKPTIAALLGWPSTVVNGCDITVSRSGDDQYEYGGGETPITWAAKCGHTGFVLWLLERGTLVDAEDTSGRTALSWAAEMGWTDVVELLVRYGADTNASPPNNNTTPLGHAAEGDYPEVAQLLIDNHAEVNKADRSGRTALMRATRHGHAAVARILLANGADMYKKPEGYDMSPFEEALRRISGYGLVAHAFLENNADVNRRDANTDTPIIRCAVEGAALAASILIAYGADINATNTHGNTALMAALRAGNVPYAKVLLEQGADVGIRSRLGRTALMCACMHGNEEGVEIMLRAGKVDLNAQDEQGWTALMFAAIYGHATAVKLLINEGANADVKRENGDTALSFASKRNHAAVVGMLSPFV